MRISLAGRAGRRQARRLREAAGRRRRRRAAARRRWPPTAGLCRGPVRLPLLPDGPRGPRTAIASGRAARSTWSTAATSRTGCCRRGRQLARRRRARRRLARVRRHRLALVRPRRVRDRPPHRPSGGRTHDRGAPSAAHGRPRGVRRAATHDGGAARVATEDVVARAVRDRRRRARLGWSSARSRPGARTALWLEVDAADGGAGLRPGGARVAVARPPRRSRYAAPRPGDALAARRAPRGPARRPPAGLRGLLRPVRRRRLRRRSRRRDPPTGCRASPTACAPRG